jgi:hypothetical protein
MAHNKSAAASAGKKVAKKRAAFKRWVARRRKVNDRGEGVRG